MRTGPRTHQSIIYENCKLPHSPDLSETFKYSSSEVAARLYAVSSHRKLLDLRLHLGLPPSPPRRGHLIYWSKKYHSSHLGCLEDKKIVTMKQSTEKTPLIDRPFVPTILTQPGAEKMCEEAVLCPNTSIPECEQQRY